MLRVTRSCDRGGAWATFSTEGQTGAFQTHSGRGQMREGVALAACQLLATLSSHRPHRLLLHGHVLHQASDGVISSGLLRQSLTSCKRVTTGTAHQLCGIQMGRSKSHTPGGIRLPRAVNTKRRGPVGSPWDTQEEVLAASWT